MKKTIFFFSILVFSSFGALTAQNNIKKQTDWITHYPDNINIPFTNSELAKLKMAYGNQLENQILDRPVRVKDIKDIFRNRVIIYQENIKDLAKIPLLSQVPIFTIYNDKISIPVFDKNNFNPLLYNFNFFSKTKQIYRVDNTNFIIVIKPRELK
mgnify:FL=1